MDEELKDILIAWNLQQYVDVFAENHITMDCLDLLDTEMIKELIPSIGHRVNFLANLNHWKALSRSDILENGEQSLESQNISSLEVDGADLNLPGTSGSSKSNDVQSQDLTSNPDFVDILSKKHRVPLMEIDNLYNSEDKISDLTSSPIMYTDPDKTHTSKKTLLEILEAKPEGRILLKLYQNEGLLNSSARQKLCNIIVKELLGNEPNEVKVNNETLFDMARQIKGIFTKENISTYFIPYVHNKKLKIKRCAKGKLYDCLNNRRREYRAAQKKIIDNSMELEIAVKSNESGTSSKTENIDRDLDWLRKSSDPWKIVEEKWKNTSEIRLEESKTMPLTDYMNEYPALKKPTGYQLLLIDFDTLYPDKSQRLYENFAINRNKILELAKKKTNKNVDNPINKLLAEYEALKETNDNTREEGSNIVALITLPLMLSHPLLKTKKTNWRPSKQESMEGFITHVVREMDVQEIITKRKEKFSKIGVSFQPTIFIVGPSISNIKQYFVVVNNIFYSVHSILQAVDVCFKLYQALNCTYPIECDHVWNLIQKGFYNISTSWDKNYSSVNAFLSDLGISV